VGLIFRSQRLELLDLSWGGLRAYSHFSLRAGESMKMELTLPGGPTLSVVAQVVWVELLGQESEARCEVGLRFAVLDEAAKEAIASVLAPSASGRP
jgi:Tfp pilus assembly protein PilZ